MENNITLLNNFTRAKNIILFKLEDHDTINNNLIQVILCLFSDIGLSIPEFVIGDIYRIGKNKGNRPVFIKFIRERWVKMVFTKMKELKDRGIFIVNDRSTVERLTSYLSCKTSRSSRIWCQGQTNR